MNEKQRQRIVKKRADMPKKYRGLYDKAMSGEASPRQAIKSFCLECTGWVKEEVRLCTGAACELYNYRPCLTSESCQAPDSATLESQDDSKEERG